MQHSYLVIGAGLTGSTFAHLKAEQGYTVTVVDRRNHVAGNAYDYTDEATGLLVHKYGPHLFHTNSKRVFDFLSRFTEWRCYSHRVAASVQLDSNLVPLPINFTSIDIMFSKEEAEAIKGELSRNFEFNQAFTLKQLKELNSPLSSKLWKEVYDQVFANYTAKMWGCNLEDLDPSVADRVPLVAGTDTRYFRDDYQCLPKHGYTKMVEAMLEHPSIRVVLGEDADNFVLGRGGKTKVFSTGSIDEYFGYCLGTLPYRGVTFDTKTQTTPSFFRAGAGGVGTVNFPNAPSITRISSMSMITTGKPCELDVLVTETPNAVDKYYPVVSKEARELYQAYVTESSDENLLFAGRLGSYQYLNMDQAVAQAMKCAESF